MTPRHLTTVRPRLRLWTKYWAGGVKGQTCVQADRRQHIFRAAPPILASAALPRNPNRGSCSAQGEMMQFSDQASVIGIMAVEGYHAGAIRELLIRQAYDTVAYDKMRVTDLTAVRPLGHNNGPRTASNILASCFPVAVHRSVRNTQIVRLPGFDVL